MFTHYYKAVLSPCIGICALDPQGYCEGCLRSAGEIARWSQMSDAEREAIIGDLQERRKGLDVPEVAVPPLT